MRALILVLALLAGFAAQAAEYEGYDCPQLPPPDEAQTPKPSA